LLLFGDRFQIAGFLGLDEDDAMKLNRSLLEADQDSVERIECDAPARGKPAFLVLCPSSAKNNATEGGLGRQQQEH
jgi:hypothetical protein